MRERRDSWLGSIPAGAGEPWSSRPATSGRGVYARGCGGAASGSSSTLPSMGLSPRVRGSLPAPDGTPAMQGSIPAGAGEPVWRDRSPVEEGVYPRGCGGAPTCSACASIWAGLSPRVRGSLLHLVHFGAQGGSIPAGAGEPRLGFPVAGVRRVYPRGCGGAFSRTKPRLQALGLSPRVRGSPRRFFRELWAQGSIPAGAGEPSPR